MANNVSHRVIIITSITLLLTTLIVSCKSEEDEAELAFSTLKTALKDTVPTKEPIIDAPTSIEVTPPKISISPTKGSTKADAFEDTDKIEESQIPRKHANIIPLNKTFEYQGIISVKNPDSEIIIIAENDYHTFNPYEIELSPKEKTPVFAFGVQTGIDIGGAIPYPPMQVLGGGNKMFAIPKLFPALGVSFTFFLNKNWQLATETTYKVVGMDAQSRLNLESIREVKEDGTESVQYFAGRADAEMSFSMLEIPIYLKYTFKQGTHRVLAGGYYAHIFKATFHTSPIQGMAGGNEDKSTWAPFGPGDLPTQIFDDKLSKWDAGFLLGYEVKIIDRVNLGARLSVGLKDIFRSGDENKYLNYVMLHMRGTLMLSYSFFRK